MIQSDESNRPVLLYDGKCLFCRVWVGQWQRHLPNRAVYVPFQEAREWFPEIPTQQFERSVHLIGPGGEVRNGADAVLRLLQDGSRAGKIVYWLYRHLPGFAWISERCYEWIAAHRSLFLKVTRLVFGERIGPPAAAAI